MDDGETDLLLEGSWASRVVVAALGAVLALGGLSLLVDAAVASQSTSPPLVYVCGLMALTVVGAGLLLLASAPRGRLRVEPERLTLILPAVLTRPLVLTRDDVAVLTVDEVIDREPHVSPSMFVSIRSTARLYRSKTIWWPADLQPHLPVLHSGLLLSGGPPNASLVLHEPMRLGALRWSAWLRAQCCRSLVDPVPRPGRRVTGLLLRLDDPTAAADALVGWAPRPATGAEVAGVAATGTNVGGRAVMCAVVTAAVLGGGIGQLLPATGAGAGACEGLDTLLATGGGRDPTQLVPGPDVALPATLPETGVPAAGLGAPAGEERLDLQAVAATRAGSSDMADLLERGGFRDGYQRLWTSAGLQASATVVRFATTADAASFDVAELRSLCPFAEQARDVAAVPGALRLRLRTDLGVTEHISFVRGARQYVITVTAAEPQPDVARALATAVAATAR